MRSVLTQLKYLDVSRIDLDSTIPSEIGLLTQLTYLDVSYNRLTSTIPIEIGHLTRLEFLIFYTNELTGTIPSFLCSFVQVRIDCGEIKCDSLCCVDGIFGIPVTKQMNAEMSV